MINYLLLVLAVSSSSAVAMQLESCKGKNNYFLISFIIAFRAAKVSLPLN